MPAKDDLFELTVAVARDRVENGSLTSRALTRRYFTRIDATLAKHSLDAIVFPSNAPAWLTDHLNGDHFVGGDTSFAAVAG